MIKRITVEDQSRLDTRIWVRDWKATNDLTRHKYELQEAQGFESDAELKHHILVITGPTATIQEFRPWLDRFVEWDLDLDDKLVAEIKRASKGSEGS